MTQTSTRAQVGRDKRERIVVEWNIRGKVAGAVDLWSHDYHDRE